MIDPAVWPIPPAKVTRPVAAAVRQRFVELANAENKIRMLPTVQAYHRRQLAEYAAERKILGMCQANSFRGAFGELARELVKI